MWDETGLDGSVWPDLAGKRNPSSNRDGPDGFLAGFGCLGIPVNPIWDAPSTPSGVPTNPIWDPHQPHLGSPPTPLGTPCQPQPQLVMNTPTMHFVCFEFFLEVFNWLWANNRLSVKTQRADMASPGLAMRDSQHGSARKPTEAHGSPRKGPVWFVRGFGARKRTEAKYGRSGLVY